MKKVCCIIIIFTLTYSCTNKSGEDVNLKHLNMVADKMNAELKTISDNVIELSYKISHSIDFEAPFNKDFSKFYHYNNDQVMFTTFRNNNSAVYYPSNQELSESLQRRIINTEKLDAFFTDIVRSNPLIAQVYFLDTSSFLRIFPYIDVISYLKSAPDLTRLITYKTIAKKPFNSRNAYWIANPIADPYGRGWVISCGEPIYYRDILKGIVSIDIPVRSIKSKYFSSNTELQFLLNKEGKLIACTKEAGKILNAPSYKEFQYYKPVEQDIYMFSSPSLKEHQNKSLKEAIENLLDKKTHDSFYIDNKKYKIYKSYIPQTDWYLFKIIN